MEQQHHVGRKRRAGTITAELEPIIYNKAWLMKPRLFLFASEIGIDLLEQSIYCDVSVLNPLFKENCLAQATDRRSLTVADWAHSRYTAHTEDWR